MYKICILARYSSSCGKYEGSVLGGKGGQLGGFSNLDEQLN